MSIANFEGSGLVLPQPVRSRSQLVTNQFLIALSQVFGWGAFTSRDVSNRFGLDFLNTAKRLSRMVKRHTIYCQRKISRPYGGYENSYTISTQGWSKISYLQGCPAPAQKPVAGNCPEEAAHYLVKGKGEDHDLPDHLRFKLVAPMFPSLFPRLDEEGLLLLRFDPEFRIPLEEFSMVLNLPQNLLKTVNRALYLQHRGLIPQDVNVPMFVLNAYERGSSSSAILSSLLILRRTQTT